MQLSETQTRLAIGVVVALVILIGYFLWTRSSPPAPTLGANQSISNPLGEMPKGGAGPGGPGGPGMPGPGTADRMRGFGPSRGAPIPR